MIYLIDSCVVAWLMTNSNMISPRAKEIITDPHIDVYASTVSFWELSLKHSLGKLLINEVEIEDFEEILFDMGIAVIGLNERESLSFYRLPAVTGHRDPFDRMLIWQAITRGMTLISNDEAFQNYRAFGLRLVW